MHHSFYLFICILLLTSCGESRKTKSKQVEVAPSESTATSNAPKYIKSVQIHSPRRNDTCSFGQALEIGFSRSKRLPVDSSHVFFNNELIAQLDSNEWTYTYSIPEGKCGNNTLKVVTFHPDNKRGVATLPIVVKPAREAERLTHRVVKHFPHDTKAYTQGLVFHDNYLYEGTGQYGFSSLRKIDLQENKVLSSLGLESNFFGEGVTIYKDKIYQLTWKSRKGFVYNLNTFSLENTFSYSTQGWGLTTVGNQLAMSDGSHRLYFLHPETFGVQRTIEVYDHNGKVENLNELEYINGLIWANVWLSDRIVVIDPRTGAVKADLLLPNLLSPAEKSRLDENDDVLNGIAYNLTTGNVYVTGKLWPKLFELTIPNMPKP